MSNSYPAAWPGGSLSVPVFLSFSVSHSPPNAAQSTPVTAPTLTSQACVCLLPPTPQHTSGTYLDTTGASIPAHASQDVGIIFSYWFLEAKVCVEGGGTFILSTGALQMMSVHKIHVGWINDIVPFFVRLQNNFTKQSHHNIHLPEEKNEAERSKLNLENHLISGLREKRVLLPRTPGRIREPEPG